MLNTAVCREAREDNRVFGVPVAKPSPRFSGVHNIWKEHTWEGRQDLIVHDSCGFEASSMQEMESVERFLAEMSQKEQPKDRLHIIWFCLPTASNRTMQQSTVRLFQAMYKYASHVPLVVVATQKDVFLDSEIGSHKRHLLKEGRQFSETLELECQDYAQSQLEKRVKQIESEMRSVMKKQTHMELCVPVSNDDPASIRQLTDETISCIDSDEVRLLCIGAQITNIDAKVNAAILQVMKSYKDVIGSATGLTFLPGSATTERAVAAVAVCKHVITCFGLPTVVDFKTAYEIMKTTVWDDLGNNVMIAFAEAVATLGALGSVAAGGLPFFLVSGAINIPLVVPAITRLYLILACDLILVLAKCFEESTHTKVGQPTYNDIQRHARDYRWSGMSKEVHEKIKELVPRRNVIKCYRTDKIRDGLQKIVGEYRGQIHQKPVVPIISSLEIKDESSNNVDKDFLVDLEHANARAKESDTASVISDSGYSDTSSIRSV